MDRLANKVAIVFGAGPNIGGTIAHFLAREGAQVVVADASLDVANETVDFIRGKGLIAHAVAGNATVQDDVRRIVTAAIETFGRVDVAVNMAGRVHFSHLLDMDMNAWNEAVLSFPTAGLLTTRYTAEAMIAGGHGGSIIHLLSTAAHFGEAGASAYTSAKAALLSFARSAAMDLAHHRIRALVARGQFRHVDPARMKADVQPLSFSRQHGFGRQARMTLAVFGAFTEGLQLLDRKSVV